MNSFLQYISDKLSIKNVAGDVINPAKWTVELTEWENLVYVWNMPKLWYWEYAVSFFEWSEMVWFGTMMWSWEYEYNLGNIPTGWMWSYIDTTLSHEEILKKFDKLLKKELKDIIDSMKAPTIDLWPIERAIQWIKPTDISWFMQGISDIKIHIKNLSENVVKEYEKKKAEIEMKYRDEIEKKNSLLRENEYNLKEKQWEIEKMSGNIQDLLKEIDTINKEKEEEIQIIEDTYLDKIEKVKIEKEEEIVEKVIPLLS